MSLLMADAPFDPLGAGRGPPRKGPRLSAVKEKAAAAAAPTPPTPAKPPPAALSGPEKERALREQMALAAAQHGLDAPEVGEVAEELGHFLYQANRSGEAVLHLRRSLEIAEAAAEGADPAHVAKLVNNLASALRKAGKRDEAAPLHERAYELSVSQFGLGHQNTVTARTNLVELHEEAGEYAKAEAVLTGALEQAGAAGEADALTRGLALRDLGLVQQRAGQADRAQASLEEALEVVKGSFGPGHNVTAGVLASLAGCLRGAGKLEACLPHYEALAEATEAAMGKSHVQTAIVHHTMSGVLAKLGRGEEAVAHSKLAVAAVQATHGGVHPTLIQFLQGLKASAECAGDVATAAEAAEQLAEVEQWLARKKAEFDVSKTLRQTTTAFTQRMGASAKQKLQAKAAQDGPGAQPLLNETQERLRNKLSARKKRASGTNPRRPLV